MAFYSKYTGEEVEGLLDKVSGIQENKAKALIVRRAINVNARVGDKYYFQDGIIKFDWSFDETYDITEIEEFIATLASGFPQAEYEITPPNKRDVSSGMARIYINGIGYDGEPLFVKVMQHGETLDSTWYEIKKIPNKDRKFSCKTRSPYFEVLYGNIICTKPISKTQAESCFHLGIYKTIGYYIQCRCHASKKIDGKRFHYGYKLRMKRHESVIHYGLHKIHGLHRGYKSIQYVEVYPKRQNIDG